MTQPEALRLADALEKYWGAESGHDRERQAAAELRRLHAEVEELRGALDEAMWHVKYKELKAVNEELLEALKAMLTNWEEDPAYGSDAADKARAAIAKAGGEA
jgi:hypothetical protein